MYNGALSLSAIFFNFLVSLGDIINPILSCDSLPIISLADSVGSPNGRESISIVPPVFSTNSDRQFKCPPAPWS